MVGDLATLELGRDPGGAITRLFGHARSLGAAARAASEDGMADLAQVLEDAFYAQQQVGTPPSRPALDELRALFGALDALFFSRFRPSPASTVAPLPPNGPRTKR